MSLFSSRNISFTLLASGVKCFVSSLPMWHTYSQISRISENQYSDHKDIRFTYKNLGKKSIKAIKFEWYCVNSFEEPAANGRNFYAEGRFTLNVVALIKSGHSKTEYWEDFSTDADKVVKIRAYYIVYTDGSKWRTSEEDQIQL